MPEVFQWVNFLKGINRLVDNPRRHPSNGGAAYCSAVTKQSCTIKSICTTRTYIYTVAAAGTCGLELAATLENELEGTLA